MPDAVVALLVVLGSRNVAMSETVTSFTRGWRAFKLANDVSIPLTRQIFSHDLVLVRTTTRISTTEDSAST